MKNQLFSVYQQRQADFKNVRATYPDEDMAGPFLMSPNEKYAVQANPLLIIGQETYGWEYHVEDLLKQMEAYETFNLGADYYNSPFWNVTRKVEQALGNEPYSCAWTNISKYDLNGGRAYGTFETTIATLDNVLIDEIDILKPKVCIFFTSPSFDNRIQGIFDELEFLPVADFGTRQLCQLKHDKLPVLTFRTYHPKYLRLSGQEASFINFITGLIK